MTICRKWMRRGRVGKKGWRYQLWLLQLTNKEGNGTPLQYFLPGKSHGWRSLVDCMQSMGSLESDTTEWLHFDFSLSCIGGGNGNPLQCSCLENPRDSGAWWAAVYGVAQSRTRLKGLSSSSSSILHTMIYFPREKTLPKTFMKVLLGSLKHWDLS